MYFRNTENTFKLLNQWIEENNKYPQEWDQRNLDLALTKIRGLQIGELPPEYCFIYDLSKIEYRNIVPVIEHFQASRTLK